MSPIRHHRLIATIALVVVTLAAAGVLYFQHEDFFGVGSPAVPTPGEQVVVPKADTAGSSAALTAGWKTYRNQQYGFSLKYPPGFNISPSPGYKMTDFYACYLATCAKFLHVDVGPLDLTSPYYSYYHRIQEPDYLSGIFYYYSVGTYNPQSQVDQILSTFKFLPASAPAQSGTGTLSGKVTVGPICPVERPGVPCPVPPEAYTSREVAVYASDGAAVVARQHFNPDGTYSFTLPAGTYVVGIPVNYGVGGSRDLPTTVTIEAGKTTTLNFSIDTGIR